MEWLPLETICYSGFLAAGLASLARPFLATAGIHAAHLVDVMQGFQALH